MVVVPFIVLAHFMVIGLWGAYTGCRKLEADLYETAGSLVLIGSGDVVKARELSGQSDLLFRSNGRSGCIEAVSSKGVSWGGLNKNLRAKD